MRKHLLIAWYNFESKKFISALSVLSVALGILIVGVVFLASEMVYVSNLRWLPPNVDDRFSCTIKGSRRLKRFDDFLRSERPLLYEQVDALKNDTRGIRALKTDGGFLAHYAIEKIGRNSKETRSGDVTIHVVNAGFLESTGALFTRRASTLDEFMRSDNTCYIGNGLAATLNPRKPTEEIGTVIPIKNMNFIVKGIMQFPNMSMDHFDPNGMYISPRAFRRFEPIFPDKVKKRIYRVWTIGVLSVPGKHEEAMRTLDSAIRKRLGGGNPFTCEKIAADPQVLKAESEFKTSETIVWSSVAAALFMIFASVLGIQLAVTLQKKRQLAMNRVFGADNRSIMIQTFLEIMIQALIGTILATAASPLVFPLVLDFIHFSSAEFPMDFITVGEAMAVADVVVVAILLATALIPSRRISKLSVIECMK